MKTETLQIPFPRHHKKMMYFLYLLILLLPLLLNIFFNKAPLAAGESYFYLSLLNISNIQSVPLAMLYIIPLISGLLSLTLFFALTKHWKFDPKFTTWFLILLALSPAFMYTFTNITTYALVTPLVLLGLLLLEKKQKYQFLALVPLAATTFFDIFTTLAVATIIIIHSLNKKRIKTPHIAVLITLALLLIINIFLLQQQFILGPFHMQHLLSDFISDLGGLSGISFFTFILAIIGATAAWRKKKFRYLYILLVLFVVAYVVSSAIIFPLTVVITLFATTALTQLSNRNWSLQQLKKFTLFLLLLGIIFSTLSYSDRLVEYGPTQSEIETLQWIQEETPSESVIFAVGEHAHYVQFFAQRTATPLPHKKHRTSATTTSNITDSLYIRQLFPILESQGITHFYIPHSFQQTLSSDQGLLFLLRNERFKLVHSHEQSEVWEFTEEQ